MQIISDVKLRAQQFVEENATTLLTAGGVVGVVGTAVLAWRGGQKASEALWEDSIESQNEDGSFVIRNDVTTLDKIKAVAPHAAPPIITGGVTIAAIVLSHKMSGQKAAALAAAYGLSQKQLEEYKDKVAEKLGVNKKQKLDDELAQDRVNKAPGSSQIIVVEGEVLCFDAPTGRYFRSTMESINRAVNSTNAEILHHGHASAAYFYDELGLPPTTWTKEVGWNSDRTLDLSISTTRADDGRPCLVIDFEVLPKANYIDRDY